MRVYGLVMSATLAVAGGSAAAQTASIDPTPDVVVTATRRASRLEDVPLAVSAYSEEALRNSGASDIRQLQQLTPSFNLASTGTEASASARIRGIGTVGDNPGLESSVATFIDGVYRSRTGSALTELGEIDRIELLRGPQGTLFGRNASAGLINIVTKAPDFTFGGYGEASYGNYDAVRLAGALTGPVIADRLAFRIDGVVSRRDGFFYDVTNRTTLSDRRRVLVRGQLLFEPSADISLRVIGDYSWRNERCCGSNLVDTREKTDPTPGVPGDYAVAAGNRIVDILAGLGATFPGAGDPYNRRITLTPGRAYPDVTRDYGGSAQLDWKLGGATLTAITAYREYRTYVAADMDYSNVDISFRPDDGQGYRQYHSFTQEARLNGSGLGGRLDWLVGGFIGDEDVRVSDNLRFGGQYGAFAACRAVATVDPSAALRDPGSTGCLPAGGRAAFASRFGAAGATILTALDRLYGLNNLGSTGDIYDQRSRSYAAFTHDIVQLTTRLSVTGGLRFTHEAKRFDARFANNNVACPAQQAALGPLVGNPATALEAATIIALTCSGNSSAGLNGLTLHDRLGENELSGTGVVSWKPIDPLLVYASYAHGYKAGGYNLDKSDLGSALSPRSAADVAGLRFDPETVDSYELGAKLALHGFTLNIAAFREDFTDFQLNTFNGSVYIVQNVRSCAAPLGGADQDASAATGACSGATRFGVRSQGVELEAGLRPAPDVAINLGYLFADTRYRHDLVGSRRGEPLDPQLFLLPGSQLSNAPRHVATVAASWTPALGHGWTALAYADGRLVSDINTGSDLFPEKAQNSFGTLNARIGVTGPGAHWAVELWGQNLTGTDYEQIAFSSPFQGGGSVAQVIRFGTPVANQLFGAFLGDPRTYGLTLRSRF
jgi:outer membrane receptor protein involved in Fe transport